MGLTVIFARRPRPRAKKKHSDESEGEEQSGSALSDIEMTNEDDGAGATSPDQEAPPERLGRGARTLAKVGFLPTYLLQSLIMIVLGEDQKAGEEKHKNES